MAYTLLFQKSDTLNGDIGTGTGSITLTAGNFTVSGEQLYVIDPDSASAEVVKATVSGTTMSLTERGVDDTSAVIHSDGASIIMAFVPSHYEALIGSGVPIGSIQMYGGTSAPEDWLICDGAAISRTTYASLFTTLGTSYGVGNGSTTFNLPDLRGRVAVGKSTDTEFDTLGETGGAKTHTHTTSSHTHDLSNHFHGTGWADRDHTHTVDGWTSNSVWSSGPGVVNTVAYGGSTDHHHSLSIGSGGQSQSHTHGNTGGPSYNATGGSAPSTNSGSNLSPYQVVHYIIKAL